MFTSDDLGPFAKFLGLELETVTADEISASWTVRADLLQPYGILHGGVHCAIVESLASTGAAVWLSDRGQVVGATNTTDFYRPTTEGAQLRSVATPVHRGRSQQVWLVETHDADGKLVARGQVRLANLGVDTLHNAR
ncbi:PaaI family thioesterase [Cryptosporangium arvum]|uniref:PaaI family thioesterase n=1 Tax=Cryptosporangium arvum TaxID=80871 RepID=UPI0004B1A433|nr:PaaI family thioesterase [Cryptosporangium arvum]